MISGHEADVGQVAIALGVVHAVADDEEVGDGEANVVGLDALDAAGGFIEQGGDAQRFGVVLEEELAKEGESEAGVENVFDDEDVLPFDGLVEVFDELDCAGGAVALAITGDGDEVECGVGLDGAGEIGEEGSSALKDTDHDELFAVEVFGDLGAHFGDAFGDLVAGEEDLKSLSGGCGGHEDSIARLDGKRAGSSVQIWAVFSGECAVDSERLTVVSEQ